MSSDGVKTPPELSLTLYIKKGVLFYEKICMYSLWVCL